MEAPCRSLASIAHIQVYNGDGEHDRFLPIDWCESLVKINFEFLCIYPAVLSSIDTLVSKNHPISDNGVIFRSID